MISASAVTTRHELIMSLVAGLSPIMKVWKRAVMTPYTTAQSLHLTSVTGKTFFLKFACNLRSHCFGEGTRVEHFSDF